VPSAERARVEAFGRPEDGLVEATPWYLWGPYLSERQWGTVREDYSADGDAWGSFPHDHARSRAYRWGEDGLAGICDAHGRLCLALALWNGRDEILKERLFGLTGHEGNHGEDAKELWWHVDALPSHALLRYRYHYPRAAYPYLELVERNRGRSKLEGEVELYDTAAFADGAWLVDVTYAKAAPDDVAVRIRVTNDGETPETLHVLPTLWFRNTWSWTPTAARPSLRPGHGGILAEHDTLGPYVLRAAPASGGAAPEALFCENETNADRLYGRPGTTPFPKDGINDHVVAGAPTVNPAREGTKAALWYRVRVDAGATVELRLRLTAGIAEPPEALAAGFDRVLAQRTEEADEFYAELTPAGTPDDEALVLRRALAGMIWCKQHYRYDVTEWLAGDPCGPAPPPERAHLRNAGWRHLDADDVLSMPDSWEYPWFATWDLAFHTVALAHVDPAFAKYQLLALCREWFQHPNGALPAYEWAFDDVNPPVHAWAALHVYRIDGSRDRGFLERIFHKLLLNFTWWVNRKDEAGDNLFEGGFLGLDNIGPFDRSKLPVAGRLEQSDATGWMAFSCLAMLAIALELARLDEDYVDLAVKFVAHFRLIADAMNQQGLWDEDEGFYFDRLVCPDGSSVPLRVRSMVGLIPLLPAVVVERSLLDARPAFARRLRQLVERRNGSVEAWVEQLAAAGHLAEMDGGERLLVSVATPERLGRLLRSVLDEERFLSPHGLRSLSRWHREHPAVVSVEGVTATVGYEPGESHSGLFGGNSNWRGPVWFPLNVLVIEALERYGAFVGDGYLVECPVGSGRLVTLHDAADELRRRLISLFLPDEHGTRPSLAGIELLRRPGWDEPLFHEYFHGDTGTGLGASHQTGWTGLVAHLVLQRHGTAADGSVRSPYRFLTGA
jgi:hypothetical protein